MRAGFSHLARPTSEQQVRFLQLIPAKPLSKKRIS